MESDLKACPVCERKVDCVFFAMRVLIGVLWAVAIAIALWKAI